MIESLCFKNIQLSVGSGLELFNDVSVEIPSNKIVWVRGLSGSGKSTFLKMLCGIIRPQSGSYLINNENVMTLSFEEFLPYRVQMGYGFDFGGLLNNRTLIENLTLPLMYHKNLAALEAQNEISEVTNAFQLNSFLSLRPSSVVGGVRKATCVARAFVMNPEMLVLDDPTTGLRPEIKASLKKMILERKNANELKHIFIVSDDISFIGDIFDSVLSISDRKIDCFSAEDWREKNAG